MARSKIQKLLSILILLMSVVLMFSCTKDNIEIEEQVEDNLAETKEMWRAMVFAPQGKDSPPADFLPNFKRLVEDALAPMGINLIIFDMHWHNYSFTSIPELEGKTLPGREFTKADAMEMSKICKDNNIHVMVGMNFLTHQNYGQLLDGFPDYQWPDDKRLWNPLNPEVNKIAFAMADELIKAFEPEGFHVGMDEGWGFDVGTHPGATNYTNATLWAQCVNEYYDYIVKEKKLEMLLWSDMFDDRHGKNTGAAMKLIPKDIIMCYWEYGNKSSYPWVRSFMIEGFRTLACPWSNTNATESLVNEVLINKANPKMLGVLYTTWSNAVASDLRPALLQEGDKSKLNSTIRGVAGGMRETLPLLKK